MSRLPTVQSRTLSEERLSTELELSIQDEAEVAVIPVRKTLLIIGVAAGCLGADTASAQQPTLVSSNADTRVSAIVASFSKSKHVTKVRRGVSYEKYKAVRSEPVVRGRRRLAQRPREDRGAHARLHAGRTGPAPRAGHLFVPRRAGRPVGAREPHRGQVMRRTG